MNIHGLQKLTLLDYPGRVACTVFLAGCNLRCPFCHNSELLDAAAAEPVMDDAALLRFLESRRGVLDGVAVTGGEPLMSPGLPALLDARLVDYVAVDIKNSPEKYARTCGLDALDLAPLRESVALLLSDAPDYEFRTTVVREMHDDSSFPGIGALIRGARRWFMQPFTDRDTVPFAGLHAPDGDTLRRWAELVRPYVQEVGIRGE